jgi:hypothetical protein
MDRSLKPRNTHKTATRYSLAEVLRSGVRIFLQDAEAWGLTPTRALMIALAPFVATLLVTVAVPLPGLFRRVMEEDYLVEWLQFGLILAVSLLFAVLGTRLIRDGQRAPGLFYALLAAGTFFIAGEEISWGQRVFGWTTPEDLETINAQQEISVHNIYGFHQWFIYCVMLGGLYGTVAPLVGLIFPTKQPRSRLRYLLIPPLCLVPAFVVPFGYRLCRLLVPFEQYYPAGYRMYVITKFSELGELCLYFGALVFAWLNLRRVHQATR